MLVVTWNVNSLKARLPRVLEMLDKHAPDIVCLQETKCTTDAFPITELARTGYHAVEHSAGRWAGVAILAAERHAIADPRGGLPGEPAPDEARWCEATVAGIRVASVYVPNGRALDSPEFPRKLAFLEAIARRVAELRAGGLPLIVAGDMNVAPADEDLYDPALFVGSTHATAEERTRLADIGLIDAYRRLHPGTPQFTWWDYRAGHFHKGLGLRIDLALLSADLAGRLTECRIDRDLRKGAKPSDHAPLLLRLADG